MEDQCLCALVAVSVRVLRLRYPYVFRGCLEVTVLPPQDCKNPVTGKSYYAMEGKPVCAGCLGVSDDDEEGEEEEDS